MSSIFRHNLSAMFRDRAYASLGRRGTAKLVGVFAVGAVLTALLLKPVPEEARAAWGGAAVASDVRAVQSTVAARVAAHQRRKAEDAASAARTLASSADAEKPKVAEAKPSSAGATDAATAVVESSVPAVDIATVPMPAPRPSAADLARAESARAKAAERRRLAARARQERREMAEAYPGPQAYRISDGRMVRIYERGGQPGEARRYASRNFGPFGGLLGLFGVE